MAKIAINADENIIILSGDIDKLQRDRFAWRFIKNALAPIINENTIDIPVEGKSPNEILTLLKKNLEKNNYELVWGQESTRILNDFIAEEDKFKQFSLKALNIRNNDCNIDEFQDFVASVKSFLPNRRLYPLQLLSAFHLAFSQNACNFSVPGSGKTSIVYGAYAYLKHLPETDIKRIDRLFIVGPLSSFGPWELEFEECFGYKPHVKRLVSSLSKTDKVNYLHTLNPEEITLISYASLASLVEDIKFFLNHNRTMVVLDEAHKAKNTNGGIIAQSALDIAAYCKARVVLTGTPAPNGYQDLYNMFKFIWPNKNVMGFNVPQLYAMSEKSDDKRIEHLINNISPYFIRIKKSDLNIPPAINHSPIIVDMGPIQQKIYRFIEKKYIRYMLDSGDVDFTSSFKAMLVKAKLIRLMQAATDPSMLRKPLQYFVEDEGYTEKMYQAIDDTGVLNDIIKYEEREIPAKFIAVKDLIKSMIANGEKIVIWAMFIHTIHGLKRYLESEGILSQELYGAIPVDNDTPDESDADAITREKIVRDFQSEECPYKVIIANPFAVAESISLHKACHNAIYIERSFNAAHFVQSKDRIHRYGLKANDKTNYYFILSKDSIDEVIDERLAFKEKRMTEIMELMPIPLFDNVLDGVGNDDIKALIRSYVKRNN